jgi:hypothetical protein
MTVRPLRYINEPGEGGTSYNREMVKSEAVSGISKELNSRRRHFERGTSLRTEGLNIGGDLASHYEREGWQDLEAEHAGAAPSMHDYEHLAAHGNNPFPQPRRWEALTSDQRSRSMAGLKAHGTSLERMTGDLGRGIDRAHLRAAMYGTSPFGGNFYEPEGHARTMMAQALPHINSEQASMGISITSPHNKFIQVVGSGEAQTPNVNAAVTAAHYAQRGHQQDWGAEDYRSIPGEDLNARGREVSGGGVGFHGNVRRAAYGISQSIGGVEMENLRGFPTQDRPAKPGNPGGEELFGGSPKASPFAGNFLDQSAPFNVSDIHMAGVVFPHLSGIKGSGININPSGASTGSKSEREHAIDRIPHVHAAIDYASRQAMGERGLTKPRWFQGGVWGEEQITRTVDPEAGARRLSYHPEKMYAWSRGFTRRTKRGTGSLYLPD